MSKSATADFDGRPSRRMATGTAEPVAILRDAPLRSGASQDEVRLFNTLAHGQSRFARSQILLERNLDKASQLARMQALRFLGLELFQRLQADLEMLADALAIEFAGHAGELDFAMEGFIRHAQQRAVGYAEAKAVGGDCCGLHVECDSARLRQASNDGGAANLPIAIVYARDPSGTHNTP